MRLGVDIGAVRAFAFCEGPGSILGIRTSAMAIRMWGAMEIRPMYRYQSLAVVAHVIGRPVVTVIADARRGLWHRLLLGRPLGRVPASALSGELIMPEGFRHWDPFRRHGPRALRPRRAFRPARRRRCRPFPRNSRTRRVPPPGARLRQMGPADPPRPVIPSVSSLPLRCWAEIDLAALERNLRLIRASLPQHIRYVAVVKADAYGHGIQQVAGRLMHAGADLFAVANITEAPASRAGPGLAHPAA